MLVIGGPTLTLIPKGLAENTGRSGQTAIPILQGRHSWPTTVYSEKDESL